MGLHWMNIIFTMVTTPSPSIPRSLGTEVLRRGELKKEPLWLFCVLLPFWPAEEIDLIKTRKFRGLVESGAGFRHKFPSFLFQLF